MATLYQMPLVDIDPMFRLGTVERVLRAIFPDDVPSRPTLITMCEDGQLVGKKVGGRGDWFVYKSSLDAYIRASQDLGQHKLAA